MMRKSPNERYATPLEVAQALEPYTDNPAGTLSGTLAPAAVRGVGRAAMTETQVVDGPQRLASGGPPARGQAATRLAEEATAPPLTSSSNPSSSDTTPSPVSDPAAASAQTLNPGVG